MWHSPKIILYFRLHRKPYRTIENRVFIRFHQHPLLFSYYKTNCFIYQFSLGFCRIITEKWRWMMRYQRIRDLREDHDLYQKDLADYLHCSQVAYSHYELGKRDIPTSILIQLANFYHTSIDYLLNQTDEKQPYPKK